MLLTTWSYVKSGELKLAMVLQRCGQHGFGTLKVWPMKIITETTVLLWKLWVCRCGRALHSVIDTWTVKSQAHEGVHVLSTCLHRRSPTRLTRIVQSVLATIETKGCLFVHVFIPTKYRPVLDWTHDSCWPPYTKPWPIIDDCESTTSNVCRSLLDHF